MLDADMTGRFVKIQFAEGPPVRRPCCYVRLQFPYYNGKAPMIALDSPAMPVFLGRVTNLAPYFDCVAYDRAIAEWDKQRGATGVPNQKRSRETSKLIPDAEFAASCGPVKTRTTARDVSLLNSCKCSTDPLAELGQIYEGSGELPYIATVV